MKNKKIIHLGISHFNTKGRGLQNNHNSILNPFSYLKRKGLQRQGTKAFTLVELIVVITILAILSTIGFVAYSGYLSGTRDTSRIASLKAISEGLEMYRTKHDLPMPEDYIEIKADGNIIAYQGYVGKNVLETIEYSTEGVDPKDGTYYSYYLTRNKKYYQLMAYLEEEDEKVTAYNQKSGQTHRSAPIKNNVGVNLCVHPIMCRNQAQAIDYTTRYPTVYGKKLGILTNSENVPIQEISEITDSGFLDVANTDNEYKAIFSDNSSLTGTGNDLLVLSVLAKNGGKSFSCKEIHESGVDRGDGIYNVFAGGEKFQVLCDMTNDGGGWTLVDGVSDRFGQTVVPQWGGTPNINNYSMESENLFGLLNTKNKPIFKYKIDRDGYTDNLELNIQVDNIKEYLKVNKRNQTETENISSTSWITINGGTIAQPKTKGNFLRITLRRQDKTENYGHLKSGLNSSDKILHSWWLIGNGTIQELILYKNSLKVSISELPDFGGLFDWNNGISSLPLIFYLVKSGETFDSGGYKWSDFSELSGKGLKGGLWVK